MSETTTATPQEQSKTETTVSSGLDRLSQDPAFLFGDQQPVAKTEEKPKETVLEETAKLEGEKTDDQQKSTTEEKPVEEKKPEAEEKPVEEKKPEEEGFIDNTPSSENVADGTWKAYLEANEIPIPEDFTEEKGFEIALQAERQKISAEYEIKANINKENVFDLVPEPTRSEAKLVFDLMAQGNSLDDIMAPIQSIRELKALSPEQLIRKNLEGLEGWTKDMVEHEMEQLTSKGHIDIEHKKLMLFLDNSEKQINSQRQQQIELYNTQQNQIRESKRQQEINSFKTALDRVPMFMDRKLSDDNKRTILNEFSQGAAEQLMKNPEKLVKFMLWDKYGEQGLKYIQARAQEQATLEKAKAQHNIPSSLNKGGAANITTTTTTAQQHASGIDRLQNDPLFKP